MSGQHSRQPSSDDTRQHIITSLFSKRDEDGTPEETLISYLKVYEEDAGDGHGQKSRYLMLAVTKLGKVVIHKAKRNNNLSFSKGKTWHLEDVRILEVIGPTDFALTMTIRRYHWTTERSKDQSHFLNSIVKVYRTYTKGELPELINFTPPAQAQPTAPNYNGSDCSSSSPLGRSMDLAPPNILKQTRSGSSSSMASGASSHYHQSNDGRSRPSLDEERRPSQTGFSRSPLGESSVRRPSIPDRTPSPRNVPSPSSSAPAVGVGYPQNPRKGSEDRLTSSGLRNVSAASEYDGMPSSRVMRKASSEGLRPITEGDRTTIPSPNVSSGRSREQSAPASSTATTGASTASTPRPTPSLQPESTTRQQPQMLTPTITTTEASPLIPSDPTFPNSSSDTIPAPEKKLTRRASFHPPPLDTTFSREVLLRSKTGILPGAIGLSVDDGQENDQAIMNSVEEMLEGFDWTAGLNNGASVGERKKGGADAIEGRLLDELAALDSANIHAFLESDDRIAQVLGHIDEALLELDDIDLQITGYKMQLNAVSDDISFIESQNRGLQVQTSNQQALLNEIRQLLQIVEVPSEDIRTLTQESPSTPRGVQTLERAAASLYKALQAGMDSEVAATIARMQEYRENSSQFCKRVADYLDVTFKYQSDSTLSEYRKTAKKTMTLAPHRSMGEYLMTYEGLILYVKEMDEERYQKLCSNYMSTASQLHQSEMKDLLMNFMGSLNSALGESSNDASFSTAVGQTANTGKPSALMKSKTVIGLGGLGSSNQQRKDKKGGDDYSNRASDLYRQALTEMINQIVSEEDFISAFLHLTDTESTFADHMELDSYFRRQAARHASKGMSVGMMQLVRSMMDLVFGFVEGELRQWTEAAVEKAPVSIVGMIAVTERLAKEAEEENTSIFFTQLFDKQIARQRQMLDYFVNEQIRVIEASKQTIKKRKGVAFFVKHFPIFIEKMESQLDGSDDLPIRTKVNDIYEKIINAVFTSLQQLAKMDRADSQAAEDKGQLNYHVIMIENMHQLVEDIEKLNSPVLGVFLQRAKGLYEENMGIYVKLLLRRSFGRFMDFFDGIDKLLTTTPASEVPLHSAYNRSSLKKILKEHGSIKDLRKSVDTLSKRVDKHFILDEDDTNQPDNSSANMILVQIVWKEVTGGLVKEVQRSQGIMAKSYADSGLGLEFTVGDVEGVCKRMK
uniref:Exocyst protein n=1 Tax=Kwoniella bestiolae CBS 10118 TaxID=1296100 RepID=A0A1B9G9W9_9TREE|nr:exocyst protein [Kwoniella bestiolae CBS 10118]OCF27832.1 exocyst protein [Kwoniella bestiolae CBS 10118]